MTVKAASRLVSVRHLEPSDHVAWAELWRGYNAFYGRSGDTALPAAIVEGTWQRMLDPNAPMFGLVAEVDNVLVGIAHYVFHASTISLSPVCYLQDLYARQDQRGLGVGRTLIAEVQQQAKRAGAARLYWHTYESNAVARRLYDKVATHQGAIVYTAPLGG